MRHLFLMFAALLGLMAAALPAGAQTVQSGFVAANGVVSGNSNFSGLQTGTGSYEIFAPASLFPNGFPVLTVTPFGVNGAYTTAVVDFEQCMKGTCAFGVTIVSLPNGTPYNNAWLFHVIQD